MLPLRIHITGASGTGTTTLGAALAQRLGWPHLDADDYYWLPTTPPFQRKRNREERLQLILRDIKSTECGIVSGSVVRWGAELEDAFDLIIYLSLPAELRLSRLRKREIQRHGRINEEFIAWAARYDEGDLTVRSRRLLDQWLAARRVPVLRLVGDMTLEARVAAVLART